MLSKTTFLIYSFLFKAVCYMRLVPYKWSPKRQVLLVANSNLQRNLWRIVASVQLVHFGFLSLRLVDSVSKDVKPSLLLFQLVWNALFMIPVLAQLNTVFKQHELASVAVEWLRIEAQDPVTTKSSLLTFFAIFLPTGALHSAAHAFNYIQNPEQPQYIISVFLDLFNAQNKLSFIIAFGILEVTLATFNWTLVIFYVSFLFGCASTIDAKIQESIWASSSSEAMTIYKAIQNFGFHYADAFVLAIMFMKIILFSCLVTCVYNTIICDLPWLPFLLMPLTVVACSTVFAFCFPPLCVLFNHSEECIRKWQQFLGQSGYHKKQWVSFRPIRVHVGKFYNLERLAVLTFFDLIVSNVINIILLFPTGEDKTSIRTRF